MSQPAEADSPTEPVDYALLNAVWAILAAGTIVATRERLRDEPITAREIVPMGAATFTLSKAIAREKVGSWARAPFVEEGAGERRPKGQRLRHAMGELVTCTRCLGTWSALGVVGLRAAAPETGRAVTAVMATAALNDFMQAGFRLVCQRVEES